MIPSSGPRSNVTSRLAPAAVIVSVGWLASAPALATDEETPLLQDMAVEHYADKYRLSIEDARERVLLQDRAAGMDDRLVALLGDQFAGMWYDHADRGRLKIGLTPAASSRQAEVLGLVREQGVEAHADLSPVRFALAELERTQNSVRESLLDMIMSGHVRSGLSSKQNSVIVTALSSLPAAEERRITQIATAPGVTVRRVNATSLLGTLHACGVGACNPPMRGARYIATNQTGCTSAFTARHRVNTSHKLVMTSGHCIHEGGTQEWASKDELNVYHDIGPSYGYVLGGPPGLDAGVVRIDPSSFWNTPAPAPTLIVKSSLVTTYDPNYKIQQDSFSSMGQLLCTTGVMTGTSCAEVSDLGADLVVSVLGGNILLKNLGELDMCHFKDGDSGGPIYKKHKAYGILLGDVTGTVHCYAFYQGIRGAENAMNVDILLAP